MAPKTIQPKASNLSLDEYVRTRRLTERRAGCRVCQLPAEILAELRKTRQKKYSREEALSWLHAKGYKNLTIQEYDGHRAGGHDVALPR